jgi:plastocyanin
MKMRNAQFGTAGMALLLVSLGILITACNPAGNDKSTMTGANKASASGKPTPATVANGEQPAKGEVRIVIENFAFSPAEVTVAPGTKVTWINKDDAPHTATSVDERFNSGGLDTDDKFSFVFNDKGDYQYICTLHPQMKATIKVK